MPKITSDTIIISREDLIHMPAKEIFHLFKPKGSQKTTKKNLRNRKRSLQPM